MELQTRCTHVGASEGCENAGDELPAAIRATLGVIQSKWKMPALWLLWRRPRRFGELRRALPGVTQHMLTLTLRELERDGLVVRSESEQTSLRVEYSLTERGKRIGPVFSAMRQWADETGEPQGSGSPAPVRAEGERRRLAPSTWYPDVR